MPYGYIPGKTSEYEIQDRATCIKEREYTSSKQYPVSIVKGKCPTRIYALNNNTEYHLSTGRTLTKVMGYKAFPRKWKEKIIGLSYPELITLLQSEGVEDLRVRVELNISINGEIGPEYYHWLKGSELKAGFPKSGKGMSTIKGKGAKHSTYYHQINFIFEDLEYQFHLSQVNKKNGNKVEMDALDKINLPIPSTKKSIGKLTKHFKRGNKLYVVHLDC